MMIGDSNRQIRDTLNKNDLKESYAEWLQQYRWDYVVTQTFDYRPLEFEYKPISGLWYKPESDVIKWRVERKARKDPLPASKYVWNELARFGIKRAFLAVEPHMSGDLHIHGLLAGAGEGWCGGEDWENQLAPPDEIWRRCFKRFGRVKVARCYGNEGISLYCSKYILKAQNVCTDYYNTYGLPCFWKTGRVGLDK